MRPGPRRERRRPGRAITQAAPEEELGLPRSELADAQWTGYANETLTGHICGYDVERRLKRLWAQYPIKIRATPAAIQNLKYSTISARSGNMLPK
jgi:hypothetical protein